jgi:hypothetical protein
MQLLVPLPRLLRLKRFALATRELAYILLLLLLGIGGGFARGCCLPVRGFSDDGGLGAGFGRVVRVRWCLIVGVRVIVIVVFVAGGWEFARLGGACFLLGYGGFLAGFCCGAALFAGQLLLWCTAVVGGVFFAVCFG